MWKRRLGWQFVFGLILAEICLRVYNPLPFRLKGDRIVLPVRQVYQFDNRGTHKLDPITRHTKNSLGFRGPDPPRDFERRLTLLTIGGSTTEGLFLSDGKTWTDQVARKLTRLVPDAWVNNAGLDGQSSYGHLVLLQSVVVPLKPKLALFLVGTNDVGRETATTFDAALTPSGSRLHAAETFVAEHSELASLVQNVYRAAWTRHRGFGHSEVDLTTAPRLALDDEVIARTLQDHRTRYLEGYGERLTTLVRLCRSNHIEPVLITQPALFGEAIDPVTRVDLSTVQVNGRGNGKLEWRLLELYNDVMRRVGASERAIVIDLARDLPKDSTLFYDYLHFTNEGSVAAGDIVFRGLCPSLVQHFGASGPCGADTTVTLR
jgi:lysophospholipase L1-like esterase